jgi:alkylation response protein AidB-like acyl-CoA dehydrogenase
LDQEEFRQFVRDWLESNCPQSQRQPADRSEQVWSGSNIRFPSEDARLWFERMRDMGWTAPEIPKAYGGGGLNPLEAQILAKEMRRLGARTPLYDHGIWMLAPALLEFGNEAQRQRFLPEIVRGEVSWCQGYSEPGAGSDLASLQTRAVRDGDHYLVDGAKIWTSAGCESDWIFCLVRTDATAPKRKGISFLLIDLSSPGVSRAPIEMISGQSEFAQIHFESVRVPAENLVHEENRGWEVAKGLLKHERKFMSEFEGGALDPSFTVREAALAYVGLGDDGRLADRSLREALIDAEMERRAVRLTTQRVYAQYRGGAPDHRLPLIMKYVGTETKKLEDEVMTDLLGYRGLGWEGDFFSKDELLSCRALLFDKALSIAGGTSEIQLNIIARNALQLPQGGDR